MLAEVLVDFLRGIDPTAVSPDSDALALDSLALVELVGWLEQRGVSFAETEVDPDDFRSLAGVVAMMQRGEPAANQR